MKFGMNPRVFPVTKSLSPFWIFFNSEISLNLTVRSLTSVGRERHFGFIIEAQKAASFKLLKGCLVEFL